MQFQHIIEIPVMKRSEKNVGTTQSNYIKKSLRFATKESENVCFYFANRSACFLRMEKSDKCMADIELAKKMNSI